MISESKVPQLESDGEDSDFEHYKSNGKPVHVDVDKEITERNPTLAVLPNRLEEIDNNVETRVGMVILVYACLTENLHHRNGWLLCHILEPKLTSNIFERPTRGKPPIPMEINSHYDPNGDKYRIGRECHTVNSVNPFMEPFRNRIITELHF